MSKWNGAVALLLAVVTGCLADEADLGEAESAASVYFWSDDVQIGGQLSNHQVGMVQFAGRIHMVHTGTDGALYVARFDGTSWSGATLVHASARADYGPTLVVNEGRLTLIYRARGENRLMMTSSTTGTVWTSPVTIGSSLGSATLLNGPSAVMYGTTLYVGYCTRTSAGDRLRIDRLVYGTWSKAVEYTPLFRCQYPALGVNGSEFMAVLSHESSNGNWYMHEWSGNGPPSSGWARKEPQMKSKKPMSIASCGGVTHLVHGGYSTPREIWWTTRENGNWLGDVRIPNQASEGGSALACWGNQTIMVHNGGYPDLWWARYQVD